MDFIQSINRPSLPATKSDGVIPPIVSPKSSLAPTTTLVSTPSREPIVKAQLPPITKFSHSLTKGKLTPLKSDDAAFDIHEIEERFKNNSNPNLGLYIAHYHYNHGNYTEAYNYALKTNAINSTMDESWLIFAKSLVKLGKEDQAKKTLQLYISNSNSENAKSYLDTLNKENGK